MSTGLQSLASVNLLHSAWMDLIFDTSQPWLWISIAQSQKLFVKRQQACSLMLLSAISHFFPKSTINFLGSKSPLGFGSSGVPLKEKQARKPSLPSKTVGGPKKLFLPMYAARIPSIAARPGWNLFVHAPQELNSPRPADVLPATASALTICSVFKPIILAAPAAEPNTPQVPVRCQPA